MRCAPQCRSTTTSSRRLGRSRQSDGRSLGRVICDLARRALMPATVRSGGGFLTFDVGSDAPPITPEHVAGDRLALLDVNVLVALAWPNQGIGIPG